MNISDDLYFLSLKKGGCYCVQFANSADMERVKRLSSTFFKISSGVYKESQSFFLPFNIFSDNRMEQVQLSYAAENFFGKDSNVSMYIKGAEPVKKPR